MVILFSVCVRVCKHIHVNTCAAMAILIIAILSIFLKDSAEEKDSCTKNRQANCVLVGGSRYRGEHRGSGWRKRRSQKWYPVVYLETGIYRGAVC